MPLLGRKIGEMRVSGDNQENTPELSKHEQNIQAMMQDKLWLKVLIGLFLGAGTGFVMGPDLAIVEPGLAEQIGVWLALPGNLFLQLIRFIVIPLVIASVMLGIAGGNDMGAVQKIGVGVVIYFLITTTIAVLFGVGMAELLDPASYLDQAFVDQSLDKALVREVLGIESSSLPQTIVGIFPTNPIEVMAEGKMLQVVITAAIFGLALLMIPKSESKAMIDLLGSVQSASIAIVTWLMKFAPIVVFGLLAQVTIKVGAEAFLGLTVYVITVLGALLSLMALYMVILYTVSGRSPLQFLRNAREPMIIAFSTSSSSATMPVTLKTAETKLKIHPTVSRLVIPLGTTINMDGTAAYQAVVVVFLAKVFGVELGGAELVTLLGLTIAASIGAPGMPGGGTPILIGILLSFNMPSEGIALILSMDRILDMCRTTVNVTGDMVTATVMERISGLSDKDAPPSIAERLIGRFKRA